MAEAQEKTVFCSVSSPERVRADVQDVPEPPMVVASPSMVQTSPVTDSLIVMVSVIVSPLLAVPTVAVAGGHGNRRCSRLQCLDLVVGALSGSTVVA